MCPVDGGRGLAIKFFFFSNWTSSLRTAKKERFVVYGMVQQRNIIMNMNVNIVYFSNRPFQTQKYTFGFRKEIKFLVIINIKS